MSYYVLSLVIERARFAMLSSNYYVTPWCDRVYTMREAVPCASWEDSQGTENQQYECVIAFKHQIQRVRRCLNASPRFLMSGVR